MTFDKLTIGDWFYFPYGTHDCKSCQKISKFKYRYPVTDLNGTRYQTHRLSTIVDVTVVSTDDPTPVSQRPIAAPKYWISEGQARYVENYQDHNNALTDAILLGRRFNMLSTIASNRIYKPVWAEFPFNA